MCMNGLKLGGIKPRYHYKFNEKQVSLKTRFIKIKPHQKMRPKEITRIPNTERQ